MNSSNTTYLNTDVLIVGSGPTGLMAANQLSRFKVDFVIIDSKSGPTRESRAIAVTPRSLEIYEQMGLSEKVLQQGSKINSFSIYRKGKAKARIEIGEIGKGISGFPFMYAFEQSKNEELLYQNLLDNSINILWETEFIRFQEIIPVVVAEANHNGNSILIKAKYVIACDGAKSLIRHQLNFSFKGGTYENRFFVADTILDWEEGYDRLIIAPGDRNFVAYFPLKGEKAYRVLGTLPDDYRDQEDIPFHVIEKVIKDTTQVKMNFEKVNWFSVYRLHHRCVDSFSKGRVFLAGDSAHIHSPAGGQGMNTGLQDAYNLSWKLAYVLKGWARPEILETYHEERYPFAQWLMKFTDRAFNVMTSDKRGIILFRKYFALNFAGAFVRIKWLRPFTFRLMSQIWYSYNGHRLSIQSSKQSLKFQAGDRLPYVIEDTSGKSIFLDFTGTSFHLLLIGHPSMDDETKKKMVSWFPFPVQIVEHNLSPSWRSLGVSTNLFLLVRPDNYIAWVDDQLTEDKVKSRLTKSGFFL